MKASRKLLAVILALVMGILVAGCGGGSAQTKQITLGVATGWDESMVVSQLTKQLLEEEFNYQAPIQELELGPVFEGVASGDLASYQDVWLPNHDQQLSEVRQDVVHLDPWYDGTTEFGIAVPYYMDITTIPELNDTNLTQILGIEPGAIISERIPDEVIPTYNLKQEYVTSSTPSMLSEVDSRYSEGENVAFIAWKPHWMNARYDFHYLEDPQDALGDLNDGATISSIVHEDVPNDYPVAYELMQQLTLTEDQVNNIENINPNDYADAVSTWLQDNRDVVQPWIDAAREQEPS